MFKPFLYSFILATLILASTKTTLANEQPLKQDNYQATQDALGEKYSKMMDEIDVEINKIEGEIELNKMYGEEDINKNTKLEELKMKRQHLNTQWTKDIDDLKSRISEYQE